MAHKFKDPKLAALAAKHRSGTKATKKTIKHKGKKTAKKGKKATKRRTPKSLQHIPAALLHELGYTKKKSTKHKPATKRKPKKRTEAELHAFRVKQGKKLARKRALQGYTDFKAKLKGHKTTRAKNPKK